MKKFLAATLAACTMMLAACDDSEHTDTPATEDYMIETALNQPELSASEVPDVPAADKAVWAGQVNPFGFSVIEHLSENHGNIVISPVSLHSALAMAAYGADGNTYSELASVLNFSQGREIAEKLVADMQLELRYEGQNVNSHFVMANNLWVDQKVNLSETFKDAMKTIFKAPVQICNFIDYAIYVVEKLNEWLMDLAGAVAPTIVEKVENIQFMLVSATKFEGKWAHPFNAELTQQKRFLGSSKETLIDFMHIVYDFEYYESVEKGYQAIVIPYMDDIFDMVIILPNDVDNAKTALQNIDADDFGKIFLDTPAHRLIELSLPKFKISYDFTPAEFISRLQNIGIKDAFSEGLANFDILSPSYNVFIDSFLHQAVIAVDESGTNTSGTQLVATDKDNADALKIDVDHSFAFAIVHKASGALVYLGVVNDL